MLALLACGDRGRVACVLMGVGALAVLLGCTQTRVYEFDTHGAQNFNWSGKLRVAERQTVPLLGPTQRDVTQIALLGEKGRDVLVERLSKDGEALLVATVRQPGAEAEEILSSRIFYQLSGDQVADARRLLAPTLDTARVAVQRGAYDEVDVGQLALMATAFADAWEACYQLAPEHWVCVRQARPEDAGKVTVTIERPDGTVLHTYAPQNLLNQARPGDEPRE